MRDGGRFEGRHGWVLTLRTSESGCVHDHLSIHVTCFFSPGGWNRRTICRLGGGKRVAQWAKKAVYNPTKRDLTHYSTFKYVPSVNYSGRYPIIVRLCVFRW